MLPNTYFVAEIGADRAENEPNFVKVFEILPSLHVLASGRGSPRRHARGEPRPACRDTSLGGLLPTQKCVSRCEGACVAAKMHFRSGSRDLCTSSADRVTFTKAHELLRNSEQLRVKSTTLCKNLPPYREISKSTKLR